MKEKIRVLHFENILSPRGFTNCIKDSNIFIYSIINSVQQYVYALKSFQPDVVLYEYIQSPKNILEALQVAKKQDLNIPFILIAEELNLEVINEVMEAGVCDVIFKEEASRFHFSILNSVEKYKIRKELTMLQDKLQLEAESAKKEVENMSSKLMLATKASGVGVWEHNILENKVTWDEQMYAIYNIEPGTLITFKSWKEGLHPLDKNRLLEILKSIKDNKPYNEEFKIIRKDGSIRCIKAHALLQYDSEGKALRMVGTNQDVTAERNSALLIKESEAKFRAFFENSVDAVLLTGSEGHIIEANKAACEMFRMTESEILTLDKFNLVDTEGSEYEKHVEHRKSYGKAFSELTLIRKDGSHFPGEVSSKTFIDAFGDLRTMVIMRDISARKMAEDTLFNITYNLQHTLNGLKNIMDSSMDIICTIDNEGCFKTVSAAAERIWGYSADELSGLKYIDLVSEEDKSKTAEVAKSIMNGNPVSMFENHYIKKDGTIVPILWSAKWDKEDQLIYCIAKDATEKKRLEKAFEVERQRFLDLYQQAPSCMGILKGGDHVFEMANPLYLELIGKKDIIGKPAREVLPELLSQGFLQLVDHVYQTGEAFYGNEVLAKMDVNGTGFLVEKYLNLLYQATRNEDGEIDGILFFANDVTDQVLFRRKVEESEKQYRQIVETAQEGIWVLDENNLTTFCNGKMSQILGYGREEMIGQHLFSFMDEDWKKIAKTAMQERSEGLSATMDFKFLSKSGNEVWTKIASNPIFESGKYKGALGMLTDITEKKKLEERLDEATKLAKIGHWELDLVTNTLFWSPIINEIHELNEDFVPTLDNALLFYKEGYNRDLIMHKVQDAIQNGGSWNCPVQLITAKGNERWVRVIGEVEKVNGVVVRLYGSFQDIHEIKNAENEVLRVYKEKNQILESIQDGFFAVDINWNITYWNSKAETLLRKKKEEVIGKNLWTVYSETINSFTYKKYHKAIDSKKPVHFEDYFQFLSMWFEISAYPLEGGLSVFFKDITERKKSELERHQLHDNLQQYAKELAISNKELEQFAFGASHDLQEPLRMITNFLTQIEKKYGVLLDERGKQYIHFAVDGAKRMRQIILDLLQFSRVGNLEDDIEQVDTNEILKEVLYTFKRQTIGAKILVKHPLPVVQTYKTLLTQVMQNLVSNALKYRNKSIPTIIEISHEETPHYFQFEIKDNGIGIENEYYDQIFVVFQRLHNKDEYSGTGMGLAICKRIVDNWGGKIWVNSKPGEGSSFYFTIPKQFKITDNEIDVLNSNELSGRMKYLQN